jgi:hypothetical protein
MDLGDLGTCHRGLQASRTGGHVVGGGTTLVVQTYPE